MTEKCQNPWNPNCHNTDIVLAIKKDGETYPICRACSIKISASDLEWSE